MPSMQPTIDRLHTLRNELTDRIDSIDSDIHHKEEPVEKDFAEQVTQRENDEVLSAIDEEAQQTVFLIDKALAQIKAGTYGTCSACGKKIADQRLQALPYATTCIHCAE